MRRLILTSTIGIYCGLSTVMAQVNLNVINSAYTQNFDSLAGSGSSGNVPHGWYFYETGSGANTSYTAGNGSSLGGDTYSFGSTSASDRSIGELTDNNVSSYFGTQLKNNTGHKITSLSISYTGEQWRLGGSLSKDSLLFEYSTDASSLSSGTWVRASTLDMASLVTIGVPGALNGNSPSYSSSITGSIIGLNIANGSTIWFRWRSINIPGLDDALAVDDFSVKPGTTSGSSDIIEDDAFSYPVNINYRPFVGKNAIDLNTGNSLAVGSFTIRDGGSAGTDLDELNTVLSQLQIGMNYPGFIFAMGIFDGNTKVGQVYQNLTFPGDLTFKNMALTAPDDGSKTFTLRVVFTTNVLDNRQIQLTIKSATAASTGSAFSSASAGGAQTSLAGDNNRIEVMAQKLAFTNQPSSSAYLSTSLLSPPLVTAQDTFGRTDQDFSGMVILGNTEGAAMNNSTATALNGQANFDNLEFTQRAKLKLFTVNGYGLINDTSRQITITNAPQKKWDGEAGTPNWADGENWRPNGVPDMFDSVVLDNEFIAGNYTINVNSGNQKIHYLAIRPYGANKITLQIPSTVTADTALQVRGKYGFPAVKISSNGILRNAGTGTSGHTYPFAIDSGTFKIYTGGEYIHATFKDHNDLVDKLFLDSSTIKGIFMFDVPGTAPYDLSINNKTFGTLSLQRSTGSGTYTGSGTGKLTLLGELQVGDNTTFTPAIDSILLNRDLINTGMLSPSENTWIIMKGNVAQNIAGSGTYDVKKMELDNTSSSGVSLARAFSMSNTPGSLLKFTRGLMRTTTTNILTIPENARTTGGSYQSFVSGPMYLKTNSTDDHLAPVGADSFYRAVHLAPISTGMTTFYIEYHRQNPDSAGYDTQMMDTVLKVISQLEYWTINRSMAGSPADAYVSLLWSKASGVTPGYENYMRVALWDGSKCNDKGGNAISGSAYFGSVSSIPEITSFGMFTLGSLVNLNPLPVELVSFNAAMEGDYVRLQWHTASEINNKGFQVQRSIDGKSWETIAFVDGHGTTQMPRDYMYDDHGFAAWKSPVAYYRLRQEDFNGAHQYSPIAKVMLGNPVSGVQNAYYNKVENKIYIQFDKPQTDNVKVVLTDVLGRVILARESAMQDAGNVMSFDVPKVQGGVHILNVQSGTEDFSQKIYLRN